MQQSRPAAPPPPPPRPQPQPQYVQYEDEEPEPQAPRRIQYVPQPQPQAIQHAAPAPLPQRAQVVGSQRTTDVIYSPLQSAARPEPDYSQSQNFGEGPSNVRVSRPVYAPAPAPAPSSARAQGFLAPASGGRPILEPLQFGPAGPASRPTPQSLPAQQPQRYQAPQSQPQQRSGGGGGSLLDQLARDYALPQGNSQPLHDISFGYY